MTTKPMALVIGDVMLDRRTEGEMSSISLEAPAPVIRQTSLTESLGGAGNVARNIKTLGHQVLLMGVVGDDTEGKQVKDLAVQAGIMACLPHYSGSTIVKHRITCGGQIICRLDREQRIDDSQTQALITGLQSLPPEFVATIKVIVIADYDKGTITDAFMQFVRGFSMEFGIPIFVDARPQTMHRYSGVVLLKPNLREALGMLNDAVHPGLTKEQPTTTQCEVACSLLRQKYNTQLVVVTNGRHGCVYTDPDDNFAVHGYDASGLSDADMAKDICGAGDTTMAALAVGLLECKPFSYSVAFAMDCAGYVVQFHGVHPAIRDEVDEFTYARSGWTGKLMTIEMVVAFVERNRRQNEYTQVVLTNGCFDGFHAGHLETLRFAKNQGDLLIVAYNDDASLVTLKGAGRPHVPDSYRSSHLAQQECVDAVVRFDGDMLKLVRQLKPDVLVKGADAQRAPVPGADFVAQHGGRVVFCPMDQFSITIDRSRLTGKAE